MHSKISQIKSFLNVKITQISTAKKYCEFKKKLVFLRRGYLRMHSITKIFHECLCQQTVQHFEIGSLSGLGNRKLCSIFVMLFTRKRSCPKVYSARKMKFSIKDFFSKRYHIRNKLRISSHLLKNSLMENFIFCVVLLSDMELLKKMFPAISEMGKTNRAQFFLFRNIAKD